MGFQEEINEDYEPPRAEFFFNPLAYNQGGRGRLPTLDAPARLIESAPIVTGLPSGGRGAGAAGRSVGDAVWND